MRTSATQLQRRKTRRSMNSAAGFRSGSPVTPPAQKSTTLADEVPHSSACSQSVAAGGRGGAGRGGLRRHALTAHTRHKHAWRGTAARCAHTDVGQRTRASGGTRSGHIDPFVPHRGPLKGPVTASERPASR